MSKSLKPRHMHVRIADIRRVTNRTMIVRLRWNDGETLTYRPGQFIGLVAEDGRPRFFSIANARPDDGEIELHINRVVDGVFTSALFDKARLDDPFTLIGPYGDFSIPLHSPAEIIVVAGGTGFAPVKACLQSLAAERRAGRDPSGGIHLYWGARTAADLYDLEAVAALTDQLPGLRFIPVVETGPAAEGMRTGWVHRAIIDDFDDLTGHVIYACGAPGLIDAITRDCGAERGFAATSLIADVFVSGPPVDAGAEPPTGESVTLILNGQDGVIAVDGRAGEPLLLALKRANLPLQAVCGGKGACGTCRVNICPSWRDGLPAPTKREARLLQYLAAGEGDRLSCAIVLSSALNGLELQISVENEGELQ